MNDLRNNESQSVIDAQGVVWLQITAGQGPKECGWVVAQVFRKICQEAKSQTQSLKLELIETLAYDKVLRKQDMIEPDAYLSVLMRIEGQGAKAFSKKWVGDIKWHGESLCRPKHKRLNWFVGVVDISSEALKQDSFSINEQQLKQEVSFEAMRSGGPGGQHVNKTSSAVRITHKPTGIKIRVEAERSQHRNKQLAMERLKMILEQGISDDQKDHERNRWLNHYQVSRGNPLRTFIGSDFKENT
jgi:peptide chain release factor